MHPFDEMKAWVGFTAGDEALLKASWRVVEPRLDEVTDRFYARVLANQGAAAVLKDAAQIERLRITLRTWCKELLNGPWDLAYYERRERIGRRHVEVGLEARYLYMAMNVVRDTICDLIEQASAGQFEACRAVARVCDMDLAIISGTYQSGREALQIQSMQEILVSHLPVSVLLIGPDGRVTAATGAASTLKGSQELVHLPFVDALPPEVVASAELEALVARATATRREITLARVDARIAGRDRNFRVTVVPLEHSRAAILLHVEELTEAIATEARLVRAESLAQIGALSAAVAHELRNPLAGISGVLQVIGASLPEDDRRKPVMEKVHAQVRRLDALVNDLLDFARLPNAVFGVVDLREACRTISEFVQRDRPDLTIRIVGEGLARADGNLVQQILLNLLLNAAQAVEDRGVVEVALSDGRIQVSDDGPGIPADAVETVFQPFFTTRTRGTGLGLPVCRKLVQAMGGRIEVARGPLAGASFVVTLQPLVAGGGPERDPPKGV